MRVFGISCFLSGVSLYRWPSEELSLCPREGCPLENGVRVGKEAQGLLGQKLTRTFFISLTGGCPLRSSIQP